MVGIRTNVAGLMGQRLYALNRLALQRSLHRLVTGHRINRGGDDPAGLIITDALRSELAGLEAESRTLVRHHLRASTAEGALSEISDLLHDAERLVLQNADTAGTTEAERQANQEQVDSILATVGRLRDSTSFGGRKLLDGSATLTTGGRELTIDDVATAELGETEIDGTTYHLSDAGSGGSLDSAAGGAAGAAAVIGAAVREVAALRGRIGSFQKHAIEPRLGALRVAIENVSAAGSFIRDTDFAAETSRLVRLQVLEHATRGALALSKASSRNVLFLLGDPRRSRY